MRSLFFRCVVALLATTTLLYSTPLIAQFDAGLDFRRTQALNAMHFASSPYEGNARVLRIWRQLINYTGHVFPVYEAQSYQAGMATLSGIYLDISIAGDPEEEVTTFFLAHEWGHMENQDPLNNLTPFGQYQLLLGGTAQEDRADTFAAMFMRHYHHDIRPVVAFLCALPDGPPGDTHSTGPERAAHLQSFFGIHREDPCQSDEDAAREEEVRFSNGITAMVAATLNNFRNVKGNRDGSGYVSSITLPLAGRNATCEIHAFDPTNWNDCRYLFVVRDQGTIDDEYEHIVEVVDASTSGWTSEEPAFDADNRRRNHHWSKGGNNSAATIDLILQTSKDADREFLVLRFKSSAPAN